MNEADTKRSLEGMVYFFYNHLMQDDYFSRIKAGALHRGLNEIRSAGLRAVRAGPVEREKAYAKLEGMAIAAAMNNGTPRTQAVLNLIEDLKTIAWCGRGDAWGTNEMRARFAYLREVQKAGKFHLTAPAA